MANDAVFVKADAQFRDRIIAEAWAQGRIVFVQYRCVNCQGRGWFGRAAWQRRSCGDCAGAGYRAIPYPPPPAGTPEALQGP